MQHVGCANVVQGFIRDYNYISSVLGSQKTVFLPVNSLAPLFGFATG